MSRKPPCFELRRATRNGYMPKASSHLRFVDAAGSEAEPEAAPVAQPGREAECHGALHAVIEGADFRSGIVERKSSRAAEESGRVAERQSKAKE